MKHITGTREEWLAARLELLKGEKDQLRARTAAAGGPPPLGLHILMGRNTPGKVQNMIQNISSGHIAPVELIACKA